MIVGVRARWLRPFSASSNALIEYLGRGDSFDSFVIDGRYLVCMTPDRSLPTRIPIEHVYAIYDTEDARRDHPHVVVAGDGRTCEFCGRDSTHPLHVPAGEG